jgi:hypothetical protein
MPNNSSLVEIHINHYSGNEAVLENLYAFVPGIRLTIHKLPSDAGSPTV